MHSDESQHTTKGNDKKSFGFCTHYSSHFHRMKSIEKSLVISQYCRSKNVLYDQDLF